MFRKPHHSQHSSPLEKSLTSAVICVLEEQGDEQTSIHYKITLFTHKYQIQRLMRNSLVYVSKAFDHATFSTLKNTNNHHEHTAQSTTDTKQCQIYTQYNKNITFFLQEHDFIIYFTAKVVPLVQHIKMCTGSLKGVKATISTTLRGHQKYLNTPLKQKL